MAKKSKTKKVMWIRAENPFRDALFSANAPRSTIVPTLRSRTLKEMGKKPKTRQILQRVAQEM